MRGTRELPIEISNIHITICYITIHVNIIRIVHKTFNKESLLSDFLKFNQFNI